ncbi:MAG: hypothetical protein ABFD81_08410 [Syntrophaceae bacterium]
MNIILYTGGIQGDVSAGLLGHIIARFTHTRLELIHTLPDLKQRLSQLPKTIDAGVLITGDKTQLCELVGMQDFLDGIPLILIIPDFEKETISTAAKLYPSFICTLDSDWEVVAAVLERILLYREKAATAARELPSPTQLHPKQG